MLFILATLIVVYVFSGEKSDPSPSPDEVIGYLSV